MNSTNINSGDVLVFMLAGFIVIALMFGFILYFLLSYKTKKKDYNLLVFQKQEIDKQQKILQETLNELKSTQAQLIHSEKMASLGELTAGIAHEIRNPLNFVKNFSELSEELLQELKVELDKGEIDEAKAISNDVISNLQKISHHGNRAVAIVKGMLEHSRTSTGERVPTNINALADEFLKLSYHGLRAQNKNFNADFKTNFDSNLPKINVVQQDISRVLLNLINNAFQAFEENTQDEEATTKRPLVIVSTKRLPHSIQISVRDNGSGIPEHIKEKIFQPFFTTKPSGQGTGLGLSLSYDIIKAHNGELKVESIYGEGSNFVITLPL